MAEELAEAQLEAGLEYRVCMRTYIHYGLVRVDDLVGEDVLPHPYLLAMAGLEVGEVWSWSLVARK